MIRRLYLRAIAALATFITPDIDTLVSGLNRLSARLDRAADRANAAMAAEIRLRDESFDRQDASFDRHRALLAREAQLRTTSCNRENAAFATAIRATRVRARVAALLD